MNAWKHFITISNHKMLVMKNCFRVGLYKQGILHDLSKFGWIEFSVGCKYFQGSRSPNNAEREDLGISYAWLHHKGRNKHHYEYWIDYGISGERKMIGMNIPKKYVVEMFIDRIAACRIYMRDTYTDASPLEYYQMGKGFLLMHEETMKLLEELLEMLSEQGQEKTFKYIKNVVLK